MRFTVEHPVSAPGYDPKILRPDGMSAIVRAADDLGYDAIAFTDHPAPSQKWLAAGGHESLDVFAALAYCAGQTSRLKLMAYLLVVPYRNPFLSAKALTTIDILSGGRAVAVVGTGYLRSEFRALGVEFEQRNSLFEESLEVMRGLWRETSFSYEGEHFEAVEVAAVPAPCHPGGPPLIIGGNSRTARVRAMSADGWSPLMASAEMARTTRTPQITTIEELRSQISEVREGILERQPNRSRPLFFQVHTPHTYYDPRTISVEEHREHLGSIQEAGVNSFVFRPAGTSVEATVDALHAYAESFFST
ncbi:TIGR03619 family F420-dependent LLM class oxidoreductase [Sporichthya polymorpha]|uniref:TIGR03619 family F420-dependent LLM class oxidoreductase n=1 Tax=Sporichthya polymorpha TaxID=35751 RepID=UPI00039A1539|nr:TIGR03619 family F420-dependent LLM class oxidoreductase [Sporichthya polymorpha]